MTEARAAIQPGHLYVVATPIGNLGDLSPRAIAVLSAVDQILAEDTRTTGVLLQQAGIHAALLPVHDHNERARSDTLVQRLLAGAALALVSDAGTPLISDPGFVLVRAAREAGVPVVAVPGPCALVTAPSVAGLPTDRFTFAGFLPPKTHARQQALQQLRKVPHTLVFYESSHRIVDTAEALAAVFGPDRPVLLARELTKQFEQTHGCSAGALADWLRADRNRQRGEFVLVVGGAPDGEGDEDRGRDTLAVLLQELSPSAAARVAATLTGLSRKQLYTLALTMTPDRDS